MERITQFTRDGLTFDVRDEGPLDGAVVVLLHGFPEDSSSWNRVAPLLHAHGLRTIAPDHRGYSPAARPSGVAAYHLDELVADVLALLDAVGEPVHLVGHDWGGGVAWQVAGQHPERVRTLTVLATPHPNAMTRATTRSNQALLSWYIGAFQLPRLPERLMHSRFEQLTTRTGMRPEDARRYAARFTRASDLTGPINWYRALVPRGGRGRPAPAGTITVPTSYVWGARDFALGRCAAELTAEHVAADYRFVELDADHWLPENQPEACAQAIIDRIDG